MGCSFWNMTFVVSEEARVLSDWAVNYDYKFSVTSCSLSISRRGTWEEQSDLPSLPRSDDPGGFFLDLTQAPSCPGGTVCPAFQRRGFPSLPNEPSAQGTIDHCPRDSTGKPSSLWVCAPTEDKQDKGHVLQSPGVRRHMACSQNSKKTIVDQHWIGKWPPDFREVECCFCLHKIDCFKFINYIKNAEEVSYLPGQISFPGCRYSAYIIENLYI